MPTVTDGSVRCHESEMKRFKSNIFDSQILLSNKRYCESRNITVEFSSDSHVLYIDIDKNFNKFTIYVHSNEMFNFFFLTKIWRFMYKM